MHCYSPNFKEVEGANWFGPVCLSVHLPPLSSKNFMLKLSCETVPEVAKGQGAEVEKGLHGTEERQLLYLDIN